MWITFALFLTMALAVVQQVMMTRYAEHFTAWQYQDFVSLQATQLTLVYDVSDDTVERIHLCAHLAVLCEEGILYMGQTAVGTGSGLCAGRTVIPDDSDSVSPSRYYS
jgi:hypothetical protein